MFHQEASVETIKLFKNFYATTQTNMRGVLPMHQDKFESRVGTFTIVL